MGKLQQQKLKTLSKPNKSITHGQQTQKKERATFGFRGTSFQGPVDCRVVLQTGRVRQNNEVQGRLGQGRAG